MLLWNNHITKLFHFKGFCVIENVYIIILTNQIGTTVQIESNIILLQENQHLQQQFGGFET